MRIIDVAADKKSVPRSALTLSAAFFIPFIAILLLFAANSVSPFGNNTLLVSDAYGQYSAFWSYYRDLLAGERDLFYSFEKTMGGSMAGLFSYYLASPFNLIFALFPAEALPTALHLIILLKLSLSGLTAAIFLRRTTRLGLGIPLLSSAYALCAYNVSFSWCIMWLDCVILLPLVALGIEYIADGKRPWLYILSLGSAVFCSYYIGFMLCIFSVLYFVYALARRCSSLRSVSFNILRTFALSSVVAGGLSAVMLIPGLLSMQGGKRESMGDIVHEYFYRYVSPALERFAPSLIPAADKVVSIVIALIFVAAAAFVAAVGYVLVSKKTGRRLRIAALALCVLLFTAYNFLRDNHILCKLFTGTSDAEQVLSGSPNIFTGILTAVLAVTYFFNRKIESREKVLSALFGAVLLVSFCSLSINMIWHGFTENHSFNYRYSFMLSFLIVMLGARSLENITALKLREYLLSAGALSAVGLFALLIRPAYINPVSLVVDILLIAAFSLLFCEKLTDRRLVRPATVIFALLHIFSLWANADVTVDSLLSFFDRPASEYSRQVSSASEAVSALPEDGLYRVRNDTGFIGLNDPMHFGYNGLSHYSSTEKTAVIDFAGDIGMNTYQNIWATADYGLTRAADSLLGVRCLFSEDGFPGYFPIGDGLYENPSALPVGFLAADTANIDPEPDASPFEVINNAYRSVFASDSDIFSQVELPAPQLTNLVCSDPGISGETVYTETDSDAEGRLDYTIEISSADPLYFYATGDVIQSGGIYVNDCYITGYFGDYSRYTALLGQFEPDSTITLSIVTNQPQLSFEEIHVAYESSDALQRYHDLAAQQKCDVNSSTDSSINAAVSADSDCPLILTIPFDDGWHVTVDGEPAALQPALGVLSAVDLSAGQHTVELRYVPRGLTAGAVISLLSLGLVVFAMIYDRRPERRLDRFFR